MFNNIEEKYKLNKSEQDAVQVNTMISDYDKKYLPDVDLRLLNDGHTAQEIRNLTAPLRLRKSIENFNKVTTKLMYVQIVFAIVAIIVAIIIGISIK